jgi:topoisomerase-4 subunit A
MSEDSTTNTKGYDNVDFSSALSKQYLSYALSTIMSRSLPDVRDGLKPVHRRLLYAMLQLKLNPDTAHKKCARVVGDVIGKYHPHGDMAVYDTLVRLAQDFSLRYPLIEGQGNFGSIDGDSAAAMRYTESRLTSVALKLAEDIDKDTVDFVPNYDGTDTEPTLLPASFPNVLANGAEGIAVGMASSIPPHNLEELCNAASQLVDKPDLEVSDLLEFIQAPDFPTGGTIIDDQETIKANYQAGKGSFKVRAKWHTEELGKGLYQVIITEIPYQVQKSKLIEKIAELLKDKKLPLLGGIRDESTEEIRIVLEPKTRNCKPETLMGPLFRLTDLETRVGLNMNVLSSSSVPMVMSLKGVLQEFLEHKKQVLLRRSRNRLGYINDRLEILDGLLVAHLNIDRVIEIIREEDEPKPVLIKEFEISDRQAEAILNIKLRSLRKLEHEGLNKEKSELSQEKTEIEKLLSDEKLQKKQIKKELAEVKKAFGKSTKLGERKTNLEEASSQEEVSDISAYIEKEPITVHCSEKGWIRATKGHNDNQSLKHKEGDNPRFMVKTYTTDKLLFFCTSGKFYTLRADNIPTGKGFGEPIRLMFDIAANDEILEILPHKPDRKLLVASTGGKGFIVEESYVISQTKAGKQVLNPGKDNQALKLKEASGDMIATIGTNRKMLVFRLEEIPEMKKGSGVKLQKFRDANLSDFTCFDSMEGLSWQLGDRTRIEKDITNWLGHRATAGKLPPAGFPKTNKFS